MTIIAIFLVTLCVATAISNVISKRNRKECEIYSDHLKELDDQYNHHVEVMNDYKNMIDHTKKITDNFDKKK